MTKNIVGLTSDRVERSRAQYGTNALVKEKTKGFFRKFLENLNDPIIKILIIALLIEVIFTFGNCNLFEVGGIILAILIATTVSTASEFGSEKAFFKMEELSRRGEVRVLRDGVIRKISAEELVVGDVVYIMAGEEIPADGFIVSGKISVDQSALNGESREANKYPSRDRDAWNLSSENKLFRGTVVTYGEAIMEVRRVGAATYYGMVARDVQTETRISPLKLRLSKLASDISKIGFFMAITVALTYLFNTAIVDNGFVWVRIIEDVCDLRWLFSTLLHALTLMITVIVVAVPEGLPMMITVVLSANMKRMMSDGVLVKKLVGIETAGSLNILFTDKTGTITAGEPSLERIVCFDGSFKSASAIKKHKDISAKLLDTAFFNTSAEVSLGKVYGGNGTDRAILEFFKSERAPHASISDKEPFTSEKKCSSVTVGGIKYIKGAPELIIKECVGALSSEGCIVPFEKERIEHELTEAASVGNRVVAAAYRPEGSRSLIFIALFILKDKPRRDTREAVLGLRNAGVQVVMLTGDGKDTATAIAKECGILKGKDNELVITSRELASMSDEEVRKTLPNLRVLARALPQDKTRLVRLSQELGLVVGMTGDGINDAPSLKLSDVGFAMGSGTDIAKGAGDIIILNNSMKAINRTVLYGRTIFKSIRKFITFQLIMNFAACGVSFIGQLLGIDSPITIIQMLWVNIIMDTLGGLAFAGEPALDYYMKESPKSRDEPILTRSMLRQIVIMGAVSLFTCIAFLTLGVFRTGFVGERAELRFLTAFYALFIFLGIFNSFAARSERMWMFSNIGKNKPFVLIMLLISVIQIFMIYFGGELFRSTPLAPRELIMVIITASLIIPIDILRRIFVRLGGKA